MKKQILFIHSAEVQGLQQGSGEIISYLKQNIGPEFEVFNPEMPEPQKPKYGRWKNVLSHELTRLEENIILVGHSLGGSILLKYLSEEDIKKSVSGLFLIAPPFWGKDTGWLIEEFMLADHFASGLHDIPGIFLYHSRDDEWVPFSHLFRYAEAFPQATIRKFGVRGHNFRGGFPELVKDIHNL
jgi:predicted alpha/beta hydrolase family esterase